MRLLHTSDWHLGRRLHGQDLLAHQARFLQWLLATARAERVAAVLVSGDVYDRAQPPAEAVALLDETLARFVAADVPLVITSGNHDSAIRLQYGGAVMAHAGVHVRTCLAEATEPVVLSDEHGPVGVYGIPYLLPDAVCAELGVERSHEAVLSAVADRIRSDVAARGLARTVVLAHAFVTGAQACESEREIRVGGIGDTSAAVFAGADYVALGHLHGPQAVRLQGSATTLEYSGSPVAFSFSEAAHVKSVTLVELGAAGGVKTRRIATPVPRPLREVRGRLEDLLGRSADELAGLADAWVKVTLTDPGRVASPMERLRAVWPHTLVLQFEPERDDPGPLALPRVGESSDPVRICAQFVATVSGNPPSGVQHAELVRAVARSQLAEAVA